MLDEKLFICLMNRSNLPKLSGSGKPVFQLSRVEDVGDVGDWTVVFRAWSGVDDVTLILGIVSVRSSGTEQMRMMAQKIYCSAV